MVEENFNQSIQEELEDGSKAIEQFWVKNQLPKEVESLPYEILSDEERYIVDKVRNGKELTQEEVDIIKRTRKEYEEPLKKYDANEIIKANEMLYEAMGTDIIKQDQPSP